MKIIKGRQWEPRKCLTFGLPAVGKSYYASQAKKPLIIDIENGLNDLDVHKTEVMKDFTSVLTCLEQLAAPGMPYQTVVIDSLDWLEALIWRDVSEAAGKQSISEIPFGGGYRIALEKWRDVIRRLERIRVTHQAMLLLIAHSTIKKFEDPIHGSYDRYTPALHSSVSALVAEYVDEMFFAKYRVHLKTEDQGFNRTKTYGIGSGERVLQTSETPSAIAKNRLGLPLEIPMEFEFYRTAIEKHHENTHRKG